MPLSTTVALVATMATFMAPALGASLSASSCSVTLTPTNSIAPTVATGLTKPRSIKFDSKGNLLVVQQGAGITNLAFKDDGGVCLSVDKMQAVVENDAVSTKINANFD